MAAAQAICCVYLWFTVVTVNGLAARSAVRSGDFMLLTANTRSSFGNESGIGFEGYRLSVRTCALHRCSRARSVRCSSFREAQHAQLFPVADAYVYAHADALCICIQLQSINFNFASTRVALASDWFQEPFIYFRYHRRDHAITELLHLISVIMWCTVRRSLKPRDCNRLRSTVLRAIHV